MNSVFLSGRLGQNPELRYTPSGMPVLNLSLAVSKKKGETWASQWFRASVFGKTAERVARDAKKGDTVAIQGSLESRAWKDKNGNDRESVEVAAFQVVIQPKGDGQADDQGQASGSDWGGPAE